MRYKKKEIKEISMSDRIQNTIDTVSKTLDTDEAGAKKFIKDLSGIDEVGPEKVHTAKFDRCVKDVKEKGDVDNPYAICQSSLGDEAIKPSHQRKERYDEYSVNEMGGEAPYKDSSDLELASYLVQLYTELQYYTEEGDINRVELLKGDIEEVKRELEMRKSEASSMANDELAESIKKRKVIKTIKVKDIKK